MTGDAVARIHFARQAPKQTLCPGLRHRNRGSGRFQENQISDRVRETLRKTTAGGSLGLIGPAGVQ